MFPTSHKRPRATKAPLSPSSSTSYPASLPPASPVPKKRKKKKEEFEEADINEGGKEAAGLEGKAVSYGGGVLVFSECTNFTRYLTKDDLCAVVRSSGGHFCKVPFLFLVWHSGINHLCACFLGGDRKK